MPSTKDRLKLLRKARLERRSNHWMQNASPEEKRAASIVALFSSLLRITRYCREIKNRVTIPWSELDRRLPSFVMKIGLDDSLKRTDNDRNWMVVQYARSQGISGRKLDSLQMTLLPVEDVCQELRTIITLSESLKVKIPLNDLLALGHEEFEAVMESAPQYTATK